MKMTCTTMIWKTNWFEQILKIICNSDLDRTTVFKYNNSISNNTEQ